MLYKWNIIGHDKQLKDLEREIKDKSISHAYLFSGPRQIGKFSIAKKFAEILQCPNNYCRNCSVCKQIAKGNHSDTNILYDNDESIKIDEIRELIRKSNLSSTGKYRIVVIQNVERMPIEAQNSFLKTLEEPPGKSIFILTTSQINSVLATIQSRVRHYPFSGIAETTLRSYLEEEFGSQDYIDEVVNMAQGQPGLAINLMKDSNLFSSQRQLYSQIESFFKDNNLSRKFMFIEDLTKDSKEVERFLDGFTRYLRKLLFEYMYSEKHPLKSRYTLKNLTQLFEYLEETRYLMQRNVNKRLALENLLIKTEK